MLLIDKPKGMTSHDVIAQLRRILGVKKIGHAGTLDPNATGLLVVGVGRDETKQLGTITKDTNKVYKAEIFLGETRDSDDIEGKITSKNEDIIPTKERVIEVLNLFKDEMTQVPPIYSAIKLKGKKAYELARKGISLKLEPRKITIYSTKLINYSYPLLNIEFSVSSGTYIRSIARDIGEQLKTGAYLKNLRRTQIGEFKIEDAKLLEELTKN